MTLSHSYLMENLEEAIRLEIKKAEIISTKAPDNFKSYPGGPKAFFADFIRFFNDPRRFTYKPLILCKGMKPEMSQSSESR